MEADVQEYLSRLESRIDEYEAHHSLSLERIEAWYLADWEDKQEYANILTEKGFKTDTWKLEKLEAPHEVFGERAANFVKAGIEIERAGTSEIGNRGTPREIGEILVGTGIEALVKGIVLEQEPEYFIAKSEPGQFADFGACKKCLLGVLSDSLSEEQKTYCRLVLKIAWDYRNNTIHSGYHRYRIADHPYIVYHVTEFLFREFFENRRTVIDWLAERREELNRMTGREYPIVKLE